MSYFTGIVILLMVSVANCEEKKFLLNDIQNCEATNDILQVTHKWDNSTFSGSMDLPVNVDESITYEAKIYAYKNDAWKQAGVFSGPVCTILNTVLKGIWAKVTEKVGIKPDCPIPKGSYKLEGFTISSEDAKLPVLTGKFKIVGRIFASSLDVLCREVIIQSSDYEQ